MKILFVDIQYDYGIKSRGVNAIGEYGFRQSFLALGHDVTSFYYDDYENKNEQLQIDLLQKADEVKPDLVFFMLFRDQFKVETLLKLKDKYKTCNWFGDDTWRFDTFTALYASCFSYCITTDKFSIPKYHSLGIKNVFHLQWAAYDTDEVKESSLDSTYEFEVSFIGAFHPFRKWFIDKLIKSGIKVEAFGSGWRNGSVSSKKMHEIMSRSKINLNLSNSNSYDIRFLLRHPIGILRALFAKKNFEQIKARNFEIPYYGGFQLADYVPGIEDYFTIGKEIACFRSVDEAILLIKYYLINEKIRFEIQSASTTKARAFYNYKNHLKTLFNQLKDMSE